MTLSYSPYHISSLSIFSFLSTRPPLTLSPYEFSKPVWLTWYLSTPSISDLPTPLLVPYPRIGKGLYAELPHDSDKIVSARTHPSFCVPATFPTSIAPPLIPVLLSPTPSQPQCSHDRALSTTSPLERETAAWTCVSACRSLGPNGGSNSVFSWRQSINLVPSIPISHWNRQCWRANRMSWPVEWPEASRNPHPTALHAHALSGNGKYPHYITQQSIKAQPRGSDKNYEHWGREEKEVEIS